jgi:hypothetical protein
VGYRDQTITIDCSDLGDDCYITIRNPALMASEDLLPRTVPVDSDGRPKDPKKAMQAMREVLARLVIDWKVWDMDGNELPIPSDDVSSLHAAPAFVWNRLNKELQQALQDPS